MDRFAKIAKDNVFVREKVFERVPDKISPVFLKLENNYEKLLCHNETGDMFSVKEELEKMRKKFEPFLKDFATAENNGYKRIFINKFTVDGKTVALPDYGGPTGYFKKTYTTRFHLVEKRADKNYRIKFGGVDYIAKVYLNGICVGMHEGFFSPFWFDVTDDIKKGENSLTVEVLNDCIYMGNEDENGNEVTEGDKLYAATGLGWNDPQTGWHHCPPGMGIYGEVCVEECNDVIIDSVFVRPVTVEHKAVVRTEVYSFDHRLKKFKLNFDICGQNFTEEKVKDLEYLPKEKICIKKGLNVFDFEIALNDFRIWAPETPWLYKITVRLFSENLLKDVYQEQFGMRSFRQALSGKPKGMFYLNEKPIKLRGANTMGFEQQDVLNKDFDRLIDDILLAKICNMNFWRLTQRPVQKEVYDYCDRLGLLTQTDLPLFGVMRRNKFAEGIRQAEEMEKLVRNHACNVVDSLINEPFPNAYDEPHRHLERSELEDFFDCCKKIIRLNNPDRVIKSADGDYDQPCADLPDNHCYTLWYNNHCIDFGKLNKGFWQPIKKGWCYGCGEFGSEGLDYADLMLRKYPKEWIADPFDPANILKAQTANFYCCFYPKQHSMEDWCVESQKHQAFATKFMTEAFRRDKLNVSCAIHFFIDAWPNGWMKAIVDCERRPKQAFFAYKKALQPVLISLRTDRFTFFSDEEIKIESYICNDTPYAIQSKKVCYFVCAGDGRILYSETVKVSCRKCDSAYLHTLVFRAPDVTDREKLTIKAYYLDGKNDSENDIQIEVFKRRAYVKDENLSVVSLKNAEETEIAGEKVTVKSLPQGGTHFVETDETGIFKNYLKKDDLKYLYDKNEDRIKHITSKYFVASGFSVLIKASSYIDAIESEGALMAYKRDNGKIKVITTLDLRDENPAMERLLQALNEQLNDLSKKFKD